MAEDKKSQMKTMKPGEIIKPVLPESAIGDLVLKLYGLRVKHWRELNSYHDKNYHVFLEADERDGPCLTELSSDGYVLKVLNSLESKKPAIIEAQHSLMEFLRQKGIKTQTIIRNKTGATMSVERISADGSYLDDADSRRYIVRLLSFIPGEIFHLMPYVPKTFYNAGKFAATLHNAMQDFHDDMFESFSCVWSLEEIDKLTEFMFVLKDPANHRLISEVIQAFKHNVQPKYDMFTKGVIHGDISEQNLILAELPEQDSVPKEYRASEIRGILDFAHVNHSYHIFDVAISICYLSIECKLIDQLHVGGHFLAGYLSERSLNDAEMKALKWCVCARFAQSLVIGAYSYHLDPSNKYVLTTSPMGWPLLHKMWNTPEEKLYRLWKEIIETFDYS